MAGEDKSVRIVNGIPTIISLEDTAHTYAQGGALAVGDVVYQSSSIDNRVELADADASSVPPLGVISEVIDVSNVTVVHSGGIVTGLAGLTRGAQYWLDTTAGNLTIIRPTINAYLVGVALSATDLLILASGLEAKVQSDATGTEVFASAIINTTGITTGDTDVRNFNEIDWFVEVTVVNTATQIDIKVEYSDQSVPVTYANLTAELISAGTAVQNDYIARYNISGEIVTFQISISAPVRGRNMRLNLSTDAGSVTASINAYKRI